MKVVQIEGIRELLARGSLMRVVGVTSRHPKIGSSIHFRCGPYILETEIWPERPPTLPVVTLSVLHGDEPVEVWKNGEYTAAGPWEREDHAKLVIDELQCRVAAGFAAEQERLASEIKAAEKRRASALDAAAKVVGGWKP